MMKVIQKITNYLKTVISMKKKVALDVDGVLLDFYGALMTYHDLPMQTLDVWSTEEIYGLLKHIVNNKTFWENIPPLVSPKSITFDFDLYLTHIPDNMVSSRIKNLTKLGFPLKPVIACEDKTTYCLENDIGVLVDDKDTTIISCNENGINGILFKPYYYSDVYGKGLRPVNNLMDVSNIIINSSCGLTDGQLDNADMWYCSHKNHVNKIYKLTDKSYPPTLVIDKNLPYLWKAEHWRWYIENYK